MLYIVHDFFHNFLKAVESEDAILLCDIVNDEVAKLVVFDRGKTIEAIKASQTKTKLDGKPSDANIVHVLTKELDKNELLNTKIAELIVANNSESNNTKTAHLSATGDDNSKESATDEMKSVAKSDRLTFVKKGLKMFINGNNETLLKKKVAHHLKVKEMNFAADGEVINLTKKEKWMLAGKVFAVSSIIFIAGYFTVRLALKKGWIGKGKAGSEGEATKEVQTTETSADSADEE